MKKEIDFLAHLKVSGEAIKDWPAWKRDIWPEVSNIPNTTLEVRTFASRGFLPQMHSTNRPK